MSETSADEVKERYAIRKAEDESAERLDMFLARLLPHHSRSRWKALIDSGHVLVDGKKLKPSSTIEGGRSVSVHEPVVQKSHLQPQDIPLEMVQEEPDFVIVNKAAGMVVHPAPGHPDGTLVNALLHHVPGLDIGGVDRPGIVHRLDKDTSGLILCAKTDEAHRYFTAMFANRTVEKRYFAFCHGRFKENRFSVITGHRRHARDRRKYTTLIDPPSQEEETRQQSTKGQTGNRLAHSDIIVRATGGGVSFLEVVLRTGRTHQIRAHCADLGHPLVADELYGGANAATRVAAGPVQDALRRLKRHALHAFALSFKHPQSGTLVNVEIPLPSDLQEVYKALTEADDYVVV